MQSFSTAIYGSLATLHDCLFQKFKMIGLPALRSIGGDVQGLTIIVTGPTSGIGKETARELLSRGATVILACRSVSRGERLKQELVESACQRGNSAPSAEVWELDVSSMQSVRDFAEKWGAQNRDLHVLINNAGVLDLTGKRHESVDGFEQHMATNFLGPFLLTMLLLPALQRGAQHSSLGGARVVNVCSQMHETIDGILISDPMMTRPELYNYSKAYAQSKLAEVMVTAELRRRIPASWKITCMALHPGMVLTQIPRKSLGEALFKLYEIMFGFILLTPEQGARASVHCASSPDAPRQAESSLGYFDSNCEPVLPSKPARSAVAAKWAWRWAVDTVKLPAEADLPEVGHN